TTKSGTLESKDELKRRIDEASKYVSLEQLALSPQCGFSSGIGGSAMDVAAEIAKLRLMVETAREVWGSAGCVRRRRVRSRKPCALIASVGKPMEATVQEQVARRKDTKASEPKYKMKVEKDVDVAMRDGAKLKADVFRPDDAGHFPVLINMGIYQKDKLWVPPADLEEKPN